MVVSSVASAAPGLAGDWLAWLIQVSAKTSLVLLLAAVASVLLARAGARARRALWSGALVGVLAIPILSQIVPAWRLSFLPAFSFSSSQASSSLLPVVDVVAAVAGESPGTSSTALPSHIAGWVVSVWLIGAALVFAWFLVGLCRVHCMARRASPLIGGKWCDLLQETTDLVQIGCVVRFKRSAEVVTPMTWGFATATILMPAGADDWPVSRRRAVLLHELVHVKRSDWLMQILAHLVCAIHWFNPLAWMAARRFAIERELACDDDVIALGIRPSDYARHLLDVARLMSRRRSAPVAALTMAARSHLEGRLTAILDGREPKQVSTTPRAAMYGLIALVLLLAAIQPWRPPPLTSPMVTMADVHALERQQRWADAATALEQVVVTEPDNAEAWLLLGRILRRLGDWDLAIAAQKKAAMFADFKVLALYETARTLAGKGETSQALAALTEAHEAGFDDPDQLRSDPAFSILRHARSFRALLATLVSERKRADEDQDEGRRPHSSRPPAC